MPETDALVVGAGPAGSVAALLLARAGAAVTIVERAHFPRRKVCGEYLNCGAVRSLDALGLGRAVRERSSPIRGILLTPQGAPAVELAFPDVSLALARESLDALLLDAARAAGARLVHARVEDLIEEGGRICGVLARDESGERGDVRASVVIGADGAGSVVARRLGVIRHARGPRRFAIGGHYGGFGSLNGLIEMYAAPGAYFAINPLDAERANVMVVVRQRELAGWSRDVDEGIRGAAQTLGRGRRSFAGAVRIGERVAVGPLEFDVRRSSAPGVLLAGDAAGFLDPFSGQGVFLALRGAQAAAAAVLDALAFPQREAEAFARYECAHDRELRNRRRLARVVTALIDVPFLARRAARRIRRLPARAEDLLRALCGLAEPDRALAPAALARLLL
jgi:flavin-dependent dehydrogenase